MKFKKKQMKYLKILLLPLILLTLIFTSCEKENTDTTVTITPEEPIPTEITVNPILSRSEGASGEGLDFDCFIINYSFALIDVEGIEHTLASDEDLETLFSNEAIEIADFVYPLSATIDDEDVTVNNGEELAELFAGCVPDGGWEDGDFPAYQISEENSCYALSYPIDVKNEDGNIETLADEEAFNNAIATELVFFVFPFNLIDEEGNVSSVADIDELFDALFSCNDWEINDTLGWDWQAGFEYLGCYMLEFPFNVTLTDGSEVTVNNHQELCDLMIQGEITDYVFPLTLTDEEGESVSVADATELEELLWDCYDVSNECLSDAFILYQFAVTPTNTTGDLCYSINFPIELEGESTIYQANDLDSLEGIINSELVCILYPASLTLSVDNSIVELSNIDDLFEVLELCN